MENHLFVGARIGGRYELTALLGAGPLGVVWRANDTRLAGRTVTVKALDTSKTPYGNEGARFDAEVDALLRGVVPDAPKVIDRGFDGALRFVVTEPVEGASLAALLGHDSAPSHTVAMDAFALAATSFASSQGSPMTAQPMTAQPMTAQPAMQSFPPVGASGYGSSASGYGPQGYANTAAPWPQQPIPMRAPVTTQASSSAFTALVVGGLFVGLLVASGAWLAMRSRRTSHTRYTTSTRLTTFPTGYNPPPVIPRSYPPTRPAVEDPDRFYVVRDNPDAPSLGSRSAPVTIVTFSDFQCPFCARVNPTLERIRAEYGDRVRIVWRNHPLAFHPNAMPAAEASVEVYRQRGNAGFWRFHSLAFENQRALSPEDLEHYAELSGADGRRVRASLLDHRHQAAVRDDIAAFTASGARAGTPSFFINGRMLRGAQPYERFRAAVERALREGSDGRP